VILVAQANRVNSILFVTPLRLNFTHVSECVRQARIEVPLSCRQFWCFQHLPHQPQAYNTTKAEIALLTAIAATIRKMTAPPPHQAKFLPDRHDLGVVAVGFSGGQVSYPRQSASRQKNHFSNHQRQQPKPGVDAAPMALIEAGLIQQLEEDLEMKVSYDGTVHNYSELLPSDDPDYRGMKRPKFASAVTKEVSEQVYNHAKSGKMVVTLGGDHSIAIGTISGTAKAIRERLGREIAVIWVDAHADINTPETSDSGNIHGMPVSFLTGLATEDREDVFGWLKDEHRLSLKKLVYIGLRDIDRGEKKILREHGIKAFSMHDVDR
jgi:arginase